MDGIYNVAMKLGCSQIIWMWHWMSWLSWPSPWNWPSLWNWDALGQTWPQHLFFGQVWHNWHTWHVWVTWRDLAWLDRVGQVAPSPVSSSWCKPRRLGLLGKQTGPSFDFISFISPWLERGLKPSHWALIGLADGCTELYWKGIHVP